MLPVIIILIVKIFQKMNLIGTAKQILIDMDYYYPFNQSKQTNLNIFVKYRKTFNKNQFQELKQKVRQHFSINNPTIIRILKVHEENDYNSLEIYFQYVPFGFRNYIKSLTHKQIALIKNRLLDACSELISYSIYPEISECNIGFDRSRNVKLYLPIDFNRLTSMNRRELLKIKQTEINRILNQCLIQESVPHYIATPITNRDRALLDQSKSQQNSRMVINFNYRSPPITNRTKNYSTFSLQKFNKNQPKAQIISNTPKYQQSHNNSYIIKSPVNYVPQRKLYNNYNKSTSNLMSQKQGFHNISYEHPAPEVMIPIPATTRYFTLHSDNSNTNSYNANSNNSSNNQLNRNREFIPNSNQFYKINESSNKNYQKFNFMKPKESVVSPKQNRIISSNQPIGAYNNNRGIILSPTNNQLITSDYQKNHFHTTYYFLPSPQQHYQQPFGSSSYDQVNKKFQYINHSIPPRNEQTLNQIIYYQDTPPVVKTFENTQKKFQSKQSIEKRMQSTTQQLKSIDKKNSNHEIEFQESFRQKNTQQKVDPKKLDNKQNNKKKIINKSSNNPPINKIMNNNLNQTNNSNNNNNSKNKIKNNQIQYQNKKPHGQTPNIIKKQISPPNKNIKNNHTPPKYPNQPKYNQKQKNINSKVNNKKSSPIEQEKLETQIIHNNKNNKANIKVDYPKIKNKQQQQIFQDDHQSFDTYHEQLGQQIAMPKMNVQEMRQTTNSPRNAQRKSPQKLHESVGVDNWKYIQQRSQDIQEKTELSRQEQSYRKKQISQKQKNKGMITTFKRSNTMPEQNQEQDRIRNFGGSNQNISNKNVNPHLYKYHQENQITQTQKEESEMKESNDPLTKQFNTLFSNQYEPEQDHPQQQHNQQQYQQQQHYEYNNYQNEQEHQHRNEEVGYEEIHMKSPRSNQINERVRIALQKSEATLEFFNKFKKNINQNFLQN